MYVSELGDSQVYMASHTRFPIPVDSTILNRKRVHEGGARDY